jgi:lipopolysaccharide export system protein LptA
MRWQKVARTTIAIAVVVFTAFVFVALRRGSKIETATNGLGSPRTDEKAVTQSLGPIKHSRSEGGKLLFALHAAGHMTYPDGRLKLKNAELTLPDRGGRTLQISAVDMETTPPAGKPTELATVKATTNVRMTTSDGLVITTDAADFDQASGMIRTPGQVQFSRQRLKGSGLGATYDQGREVLWLLKDARISIVADAEGQGAAEGSADSAGFARNEPYVRMTGNAKIDGDGRHTEASDITIQLSEDEKRIQTVQLRGNSRITGTGTAGSAPQNMAARDIDLTYAPDGKALQQARLMEGASVQLPGSPGAPGRQVAGRNMVIAMAPDGSTVTALDATEQVQVDLPAATDAPARRITSSSLTATGPPDAGLQNATFTGNAEFRETHPGARGTQASERVARSQRIIVETKPGFGDIQQADFRGNVRFEDGATVGEAQRAVYKVAGDSLQLMPSNGDPGPPPRLNDERISVDARALTLELQTRKLVAENTVRSSLQSSKGAEGRSGGRKGKGTQSEQRSKLPSMLKSDEPVFVNSNKMEYDGTSIAVYTGDARLFQGQTTVVGEAITLDDKAGNMTARGNVRTVMFFDDVDPKTKVKKSTQTTGTADQLVYEDAKRLATYITGPTANAHIVGPQGDLTAEKIELFLKEKANELERAEADGKVDVKEGERRSRGDHLTYTSADELYVMKGNPLEVERRAPGECSKTLGVTMRFHRGDDTLVVDGIPGVTPFNTKPIPCTH